MIDTFWIMALVVGLALLRVAFMMMGHLNRYQFRTPGSRRGRLDLDAVAVRAASRIGTARPARQALHHREYRSSLGVRGLTAVLSLAVMAAATSGDAFLFDGIPPLLIPALLGLLLIYANLYVWRFAVRIDGSEIVVVTEYLTERRFDLKDLTMVTEDGMHRMRLYFMGGKKVDLLKSVEGYDELMQVLDGYERQNARG